MRRAEAVDALVPRGPPRVTAHDGDWNNHGAEKDILRRSKRIDMGETSTSRVGPEEEDDEDPPQKAP